jgi:hypothetical protein
MERKHYLNDTQGEAPSRKKTVIIADKNSKDRQ